jgi:hypothetical protein
VRHVVSFITFGITATIFCVDLGEHTLFLRHFHSSVFWVLRRFLGSLCCRGQECRGLSIDGGAVEQLCYFRVSDGPISLFGWKVSNYRGFVHEVLASTNTESASGPWGPVCGECVIYLFWVLADRLLFWATSVGVLLLPAEHSCEDARFLFGKLVKATAGTNRSLHSPNWGECSCLMRR